MSPLGIGLLHVCENICTNETIEEAARRSGGHFAILLALQILSFQAKILQ
jgi:hypothetical protein